MRFLSMKKLFTYILLTFLASPSAMGAETEKVIIWQGSSTPVLTMLADKLGFFAQEGLSVEFKRFPTGRQAFEGMLAGNCDFSISAEFPVVTHAFRRKDFAVLASLKTSYDVSRLVVRKDMGIAAVSDLKGKKIATPRGTAPHYFLELLLEKNGINLSDATVIHLEPDEIEKGFANGDFHAVAITTPRATLLANKMGDKASVISEMGLCLNYTPLTVMRDTLATKKGLAEKLLKALVKAENWLRGNPAGAKEIIQAEFGFTDAAYERERKNNINELALPRGLVLIMEDYARWSMEKDLARGERAPNFLEYIEPGPLRSVASDAVTLSR